MATDWIMTRLRTATHARLDALRQRLLTAFYTHRRGPLPLGSNDTLSVDALVNMLIDHKLKHMERSNRKRRKDARPPTPTTNGSEEGCIHHPPQTDGGNNE